MLQDEGEECIIDPPLQQQHQPPRPPTNKNYDLCDDAFANDAHDESGGGAGSGGADGGGIISIGVLPYVGTPSQPPRRLHTDPDTPAAGTNAAGSTMAAYKAQAAGMLARLVPQAVQSAVSSDMQYIIASKIAAQFASVQSPRGGGGDGDGRSSPRSCRPRLYRVRRSLRHLLWFRDMMTEKVPYCVWSALPTSKEDAHTRDGVDSVVAFLSIFAACPALTGDPLFWSLLTKPDDEFEEMFLALKPSAQIGASGGSAAVAGVGNGGAATTSSSVGGGASALMGQLQKRFLSNAKKLIAPTKYPSKALKPDKISDMLMETGVIDRALMTLDKVSSCVKSSYYFDDARAANAPREKAWEDAANKAFDLREVLEEERLALADVGAALRDLAFPSYWPWTRDSAMEEVVVARGGALATPPRPTGAGVATSSSATAPCDDASPLADAGGTPDDRNERTRPSSPPPAAHRPPPSQRLSHYLHRVANASTEMGRLSALMFHDEFAVHVNLYRLTVAARTLSAAAAHERLHSTEHQPRPRGRGLCEIQQVLNKLIAEGTGHTELDAFEAMDEELSTIHEAIDEAVVAFEGHCNVAMHVMRGRWERGLKEMVLGQVVHWKGALLLLADLKTTLELDRFMDDEALPFTNAPVIHNPSPLQRRRFDAQQQVWGQQISAYNTTTQDAEQQNDAAQQPARSGFGALLLRNKNTKRRQAFREGGDDDDGNMGGNPFDTEVEMTSASPLVDPPVGGGGASPTARADGSPRRGTDGSATSPTFRGREPSVNVLPDDLQAVVRNQSSQFLLDRDTAKHKKQPSSDRPPEEAAFDDEFAKRDAKKGSWKRNAQQGGGSGGGGGGWGSVAAADDEDPFRF